MRASVELSSLCVTLALVVAMPARAEPARAEPTRAEPTRAEPTRAEPTRDVEPTAPSDGAPRTDTEEARRAFDRGLGLVRDEDYRAAIAEFSRAYDLHPHHAVLYNVAQSYARLGEYGRAATYLERHLQAGGEEIPEPVRLEREAELRELRSSFEGDAPDPRPSDADSIAQARRALAPTPPLEPLVAPSHEPEAALALASQAQAGTLPTRADADPPYLPLALGAAGLASVGVGVGILVWNQERYATWQAADAQLAELRGCGPQCTTSTAEEVNARQRANNDLGASIRQADVVWIAVGTAGVALLGSAAYLAWRSPPGATTSARVILGPGALFLHGRW